MTATYLSARDEMFELFVTGFAADAAVIAGGAIDVRYQGVVKKNLPAADKYWVRLSTKNVTTRQTAHGQPDDAGQGSGKGVKVHTTRGLIFVEVFAPMSDVEGFERGGKLAELAQGIFQNAETSSSVWFRNVRINDLPDDGKAFRFNVVAEYQFDQTKE